MRRVVLLAMTAFLVPSSSTAQTYKIESPGAGALEALERAQLCREIVHAGGQCPAAPVPTADLQAYYHRLMDAQWAALLAEMRQQELLDAVRSLENKGGTSSPQWTERSNTTRF
jgi:hypothetical protein